MARDAFSLRRRALRRWAVPAVLAALLFGPSLWTSRADDPPPAGHADAQQAGDDGDEDSDDSSGETIDPMSVNATCYVCHMTFVHEPISKVHFKAKVTCVECHGTSAGHANDENIGATKPDKMYSRDQVDAMCGKCHEGHDVPAAAVVERFREREIEQTPVVCTDCHGEHRIDRAAEKE